MFVILTRVLAHLFLQFLKADALKNFESNPRDWYKCSELKRAWKGATVGQFDPLGCLDFYAPHAYPLWEDPVGSRLFMPFNYNKSVLEVDVPVLLGEFWNIKNAGASHDSVTDPHEPITGDDFVKLYQQGYAGGLGWAWLNPKEVPDGKGGWIRTLAKHELQDKWRAILTKAAVGLRKKGAQL